MIYIYLVLKKTLWGFSSGFLHIFFTMHMKSEQKSEALFFWSLATFSFQKIFSGYGRSKLSKSIGFHDFLSSHCPSWFGATTVVAVIQLFKNWSNLNIFKYQYLFLYISSTDRTAVDIIEKTASYLFYVNMTDIQIYSLKLETVLSYPSWCYSFYSFN